MQCNNNIGTLVHFVLIVLSINRVVVVLNGNCFICILYGYVYSSEKQKDSTTLERVRVVYTMEYTPPGQEIILFAARFLSYFGSIMRILNLLNLLLFNSQFNT